MIQKAGLLAVWIWRISPQLRGMGRSLSPLKTWKEVWRLWSVEALVQCVSLVVQEIGGWQSYTVDLDQHLNILFGRGDCINTIPLVSLCLPKAKVSISGISVSGRMERWTRSRRNREELSPPVSPHCSHEGWPQPALFGITLSMYLYLCSQHRFLSFLPCS